MGAGLVASLARPGGNITGLSMLAADLAGKRLELLREVVPGFSRLAIMVNVGFPDAVLEMGEVQAAARTLGLEIAHTRNPASARISRPLSRRSRTTRTRFMSVPTHSLTPTGFASTHWRSAHDCRRCTAIQESVEAGGLMSYGANFTDLFRRAGDYVDKILRGAKPGDIPVEQPTKFDLVINLTTAKALGLTVPPATRARRRGNRITQTMFRCRPLADIANCTAHVCFSG